MAEWQPVTGEDLEKKRTKKGVITKVLAQGHTPGPKPEVAEDGVAVVPIDQLPYETPDPRAVHGRLLGQYLEWARGPGRPLVVAMMRSQDPAAYAHLSHEELDAKVNQFLTGIVQDGVENAYRGIGKHGSDLDRGIGIGDKKQT